MKNRIRKVQVVAVLGVFLILQASCTSKTTNTQKQETASVMTTSNASAQDTDQYQEGNERGYLVKVGDSAPDFEMTLTSGEKIKLSDERGKVVMLQFTASWCSVCKKEMPHIESEIWQANKNNKQFALLGIDRDEPLDKVLAFKDKTKITYPLGLDPQATIFGKYADKRAGITRNVIINKEGKIVFLTRMYDENEFNTMVSVIAAELKK